MKKTITVLMCLFVCVAVARAGVVNLPFTVDGEKRTAALYVPEGYDKANEWPLIVYLHGGGRGGDNNGDAMEWGKREAVVNAVEKHPDWFPGLVLMPRCPKGKIWAPGPKDPVQSKWRLNHHGTDPVPDAEDHVTAAIDEAVAKYSIDEERITMIGHSMGGEGSTLYAPRHADRIAAIAPSAGSAIIVPENAPILAKMGVWIFQGENDGLSTKELARQMVAAIKKEGGDVKYTELKGVGHGSLGPMFQDDKVLKWISSQKLRSGAEEASSSTQDRPNIVFILADDLGWQDVGYMGANFFETPNIDRLAAEGMKFTAAYSAGPNCSPTRATLMTGTYTPRHKIYTPNGKSKGNTKYMRLLVPARKRINKALNKKAAEQFEIRNNLPSEFVCIPELLKESGYRSARLGKWHLGPDTQGFDLSSADGLGGASGTFYGNIDVAEQLTDRAIQFIEENKNTPFFLYLCHWDVHTPHRARAAVVKNFKAKLDALTEDEHNELKKLIPSYKKETVPVYAAMVDAVDRSVGRILAKVQEAGLSKNTIIIFTSDNGGLTHVSQLKPLRGMKGSLFEAGVRVPACIRWEGTIAPGSKSDTAISSVDFLPTLASLAKAPLPKEQPVDGIDISPIFFGREIKERSLFWHYPLYLKGRGLDIETPDGKPYSWRGFPSSSLVRGKYKLIEFHEDKSIALYDLSKDASEQRNIAELMPELAAQLKAELDAWQAKVKAPIPTEPNPDCILD